MNYNKRVLKILQQFQKLVSRFIFLQQYFCYHSICNVTCGPIRVLLWVNFYGVQFSYRVDWAPLLPRGNSNRLEHVRWFARTTLFPITRERNGKWFRQSGIVSVRLHRQSQKSLRSLRWSIKENKDESHLLITFAKIFHDTTVIQKKRFFKLYTEKNGYSTMWQASYIFSSNI